MRSAAVLFSLKHKATRLHSGEVNATRFNGCFVILLDCELNVWRLWGSKTREDKRSCLNFRGKLVHPVVCYVISISGDPRATWLIYLSRDFTVILTLNVKRKKQQQSNHATVETLHKFNLNRLMLAIICLYCVFGKQSQLWINVHLRKNKCVYFLIYVMCLLEVVKEIWL